MHTLFFVPAPHERGGVLTGVRLRRKGPVDGALRWGHIPALPCPRLRGRPTSGISRIAEVLIVQQPRRQNVHGLARNHHYVPQWLLRQWRSELGRLWVAKRVRGHWDIKLRSIRNSFSQEGLYDFLPAASDAHPSDSVERRLSSIESHVARSWKGLRRMLDRRVERVHVGSASGAWLKFHILLQLTRTPQFLERLRGQIRYGQPEIDRAVARVEALGGRVTEEERKAIADGSMLRECMQNALASNVIMQDVGSRSWRILMEQRRLVVGRAVNNVRFVISDQPVLYCNSVPGSGSTLANRHLQLWTPVSPRYALGLVDPSDLSPGTVVSLNSDKVRKWNESLFRDCRVCAGRTRTDLSFLLSICEN